MSSWQKTSFQRSFLKFCFNWRTEDNLYKWGEFREENLRKPNQTIVSRLGNFLHTEPQQSRIGVQVQKMLPYSHRHRISWQAYGLFK